MPELETSPELDFLANLNINELRSIAIAKQKRLIQIRKVLIFSKVKKFEIETEIDPHKTIEEYGRQMNFQSGSADFTKAELWIQFKREIRDFFCTNSKKYAEHRRNLYKSASKSNMLVVSTLSAAIASNLGAIPGVLVPICALCLIALAKVGKEAFCAMADFDLHV